MTEAELRTLMADMESDRIERTTSFREDKLGPVVCAFANDLPNHQLPGYVLLGVNDDGCLGGLTIDDDKLQQIGNVRSNGKLLPPPSLTVSSVFHLDGGDVVVVEVHPSTYPPVRFDGRVWIRIGPRRAIATQEEENRLSDKRLTTARSFDKEVFLGSGISDLSMDSFQLTYLPKAIDEETLAANGRSPEQQLASLGFYDLTHRACTHAGILMFATNPRYFVSGAYIQYVRFNSSEMDATTRSADREFSGGLITLLGNLEQFVSTVVIQEKAAPIHPDSFQEKRIYNYPRSAIREFLMNAIIHRDYRSNAPIYLYEFTDRIEIVNPGGLFGNARPENFPEVSDYRNPLLATAVKNLGFVNRFNYGIVSSQRALRNNGNPEAIFDFSRQTKFSVTVKINPAWHA